MKQTKEYVCRYFKNISDIIYLIFIQTFYDTTEFISTAVLHSLLLTIEFNSTAVFCVLLSKLTR